MTDGTNSGSQGSQPSSLSEVGLTSLAPKFIEEQHRTYVNRLRDAVQGPKNYNIALTGRYGAGKSSVLEKFVEEEQAATQPPTGVAANARAMLSIEVRRRLGWQRDRVVRLSISTLDHNEQAGASGGGQEPATTVSLNSGGAGVVIGATEGPEDTLTNRIQKELVKQLVYSARPKTLRHSRFNRIIPLSWARALLEGAGAVAALWVLLFFIDKLPKVAGTGGSHAWWWRIGAWFILGALFAVGYAIARKWAYNRFVVSDFSAGGATVRLSERTATYFDEYMDEIVHYFDTESPDIVVFEDLDRFNDPNIFEALREVNTTLNRTTHRVAKGIPLRFVYAVRDSLFEQLGADTVQERREAGDAAAAEVVRANRTKFFEVVVPIVPFISHRNARELLEDRLKDANIVVGAAPDADDETRKNTIERRLVALVAQHATDMRLLTNITNEYLVFAQRLLEAKNPAPGITASNLFALVAYKNFHLADFENIARSASDLDTLNRLRRDLVSTNVARLEAEKRDLQSRGTGEGARARVAKQFAERLRLVIKAINAGSSQGMALTFSTADGATHDPADFETYKFWRSVAASGSIEVTGQRPGGYRPSSVLTLDRNQLNTLLPNVFNARRWDDLDEADAQSRLASIEREVRMLRGADFADLAKTPDYKVAAGPSVTPAAIAQDNTPAASVTEEPFVRHIEATLNSELARDLVKRGHIDRNFTLYAAQFYGTFFGVDVATFLVQSVQTNTPESTYPFTSPNAVPNLLEEAGDDFTHTVAAYNNDILDHLLGVGDPRAANIVSRVVSEHDDAARSFMASYLTSGQRRAEFAAALARQPWTDTFTHLVSGSGVPDDDRPALLSAALTAAHSTHSYDLDGIAEFMAEHYEQMDAFTAVQDDDTAQVVARILSDAGTVLPKLTSIEAPLLDLVITSQRFDLTAPNLRAALFRAAAASGTTDTPQASTNAGVDLDRIRALLHSDSKGWAEGTISVVDAVYDLCLRLPDRYLDAVEGDNATAHAISDAATLAAVLTDIVAAEDEADLAEDNNADQGSTRGRWASYWNAAQIERLLTMTAPGARLDGLEAAPTSAWKLLAHAGLFEPSLANVEVYIATVGSVDATLGSLLTTAGHIAGAPEPAPTGLDETAATSHENARAAVVPTAVAIMNGASISTSDRVDLARGLNPALPLPATDITAEANDLFAIALEADLITDDETTFRHLRAGGWTALAPAITASDQFTAFANSEVASIVAGMVVDVFGDAVAAAQLGRRIVADVELFVPDDGGDHAAALRAIAGYAKQHHLAVTPHIVARIAAAGGINVADLLRLLRDADPAPDASDIVKVFGFCGDPYNQIATSGAKFRLPKDDLHEPLLRALHGPIIDLRKVDLREKYNVRVL